MSDDLFAKNYFEIFSVAESMEVDIASISGCYHELQKKYHPDRFVNSDDQASRLAMQHTSLINSAFETLKNPLSRAQYLLKLKGIDTHAETDTTMDTGFLMAQMELRESLAEINNQPDPLGAADLIAADLKKQMQQLMAEFQTNYVAEQLDQAREAIRKMQFILKAQKEVKAISEQLEDDMF